MRVVRVLDLIDFVCARTSSAPPSHVAANGRSARRSRSPRGKTGPPAPPHDDGVGWGSPVTGEPTVRRRGSSRADRVLVADAARDRRRAGLGAIRSRGSQVAADRNGRPPLSRSHRASRRRPVSRGSNLRRAGHASAQNHLRRPRGRAGPEYADGDRLTPMMTSRLTGAAANPSRRGHRQPGRRR
jgi:hypothetical protein